MGSPSLVKDLMELHKYIDSCNNNNNEVDSKKYNDLLNNLLEKMKIDLKGVMKC
jgi:hypothetical protein